MNRHTACRAIGQTLGVAFTAIALIGVPAACAQTRAVVELFTSQGCSSCPPADKLMGELGRDPGTLVLSLAVDYWDYLGWKDTLSLPAHSKRQRAYSKSRGDREVYTPQVVVNGLAQVLGSDRAAIEAAIGRTLREPGTMSVPVKIAVIGQEIKVQLGARAAGADIEADVWLCPVAESVPIVIERGENRGRTITYHNVVRRWIRLGRFSGSADSYSLPVSDVITPAEVASADSVAVLVQERTSGHPGVIVGAAIARLRGAGR